MFIIRVHPPRLDDALPEGLLAADGVGKGGPPRALRQAAHFHELAAKLGCG